MRVDDPTLLIRAFDQPKVWVVSAKKLAAARANIPRAWTEEDRGFASIEALAAAYPQLHRQAPLDRVAAALAALEHRQLETGDTLAGTLAPHQPPPDRFAASTDRVVDFHADRWAPPLAEMVPPNLQGDVLTTIEHDEPTVQWQAGKQVYLTAHRVITTFSDSGWTRDATELSRVAHPPTQARAFAKRVFGGEIEGYWSFPLGDRQLVVPHGRGPGAAAFVLIDDDAPTPLADWASVRSATQSVGEREALRLIADAMLNDLNPDSWTLIDDPSAFLETWNKSGRRVRSKRYHQGSYYETVREYTLVPGAEVRAPAIDADGNLSVHATSASGPPKAFSFDLTALTFPSTVLPTSMTTSAVVYDEGVDSLPRPSDGLPPR